VARRVGKGGKGLVRTCDMTEVVAAVDGSHPSMTCEEAADRAAVLTEEIKEGCGGEAALRGASYLVLGLALHQLGTESNSAAMDAHKAWQRGVELVASPCIEAEALVKVGGLLYLSRTYVDKQQFVEAGWLACPCAMACMLETQRPARTSVSRIEGVEYRAGGKDVCPYCKAA
jgi:hypothetical protein